VNWKPAFIAFLICWTAFAAFVSCGDDPSTSSGQADDDIDNDTGGDDTVGDDDDTWDDDVTDDDTVEPGSEFVEMIPMRDGVYLLNAAMPS